MLMMIVVSCLLSLLIFLSQPWIPTWLSCPTLVDKGHVGDDGELLTLLTSLS
jgi:hypothetical protein